MTLLALSPWNPIPFLERPAIESEQKPVTWQKSLKECPLLEAEEEQGDNSGGEMYTKCMQTIHNLPSYDFKYKVPAMNSGCWGGGIID